MAEGPFSENEKPNFFSSVGEEWRILGEGFTTGLLFLTRGCFFHHWRGSMLDLRWWSPLRMSTSLVIVILHSPFSEKATKGCHAFLHGETILLDPLFPHSPFSENPFSDLREGVTTPNKSNHYKSDAPNTNI
jgi:hypothetical protein